jgi:hypothetical protein
VEQYRNPLVAGESLSQVEKYRNPLVVGESASPK